MGHDHTRTALLRVTAILLATLCAAAETNPYCEAPLPRYVPVEEEGLVLRQVVVLSRHGDRSPLTALPHEHAEAGVVWDCAPLFAEGANVSDAAPTLAYAHYAVPSTSSSISTAAAGWRGNCPLGYLTARGAQQTHALGRALRAAYVDTARLLPATPDPALLHLRATEVPRARHSLLAALAGLYPGAEPVLRYEVRAAAHETLLPNSAACPRVARLAARAQQQPAWRALAARLAPRLARLDRIAGVSASDAASSSRSFATRAIAWFDVLEARACHGMPLPCSNGTNECATEEDVAALAEVAREYANSVYDVNASGSGEMAARLAAGPLVREVLALLEAGARGDAGRAPRYAHLSGHDTTLLALMAALQCRLPAFPPYAATVRVELFAAPATARHYVRALYNNDVLVVPDCAAPLCPLETFRAMVAARLTPRDPAECDLPDDDGKEGASAPWPAAAVAAVAVLVAVLELVSVALVVVVVVVVKRRRTPATTGGSASQPLLAPVNSAM